MLFSIAKSPKTSQMAFAPMTASNFLGLLASLSAYSLWLTSTLPSFHFSSILFSNTKSIPQKPHPHLHYSQIKPTSPPSPIHLYENSKYNCPRTKFTPLIFANCPTVTISNPLALSPSIIPSTAPTVVS